MKQLFPICLFITLTSSLFARQLSSGISSTDLKISGSNEYTFTIDFGALSVNETTDHEYSLSLAMPGAHLSLKKDEPELPYVAYSFAVGATQMQLSVTDAVYTDYAGYDVVPSKGNFDRTIDPSSVAAVRGAVYSQNAFYPAQITQLADDYMIREMHGNTIHVFPVQYNPVTHILRVYAKMTIKVSAQIPNAPRYERLNWQGLYRNQFINYDLLKTVQAKTTGTKDSIGCVARMLIITPPAYKDSLKQFMQWKHIMGIRSDLVLTTSIPGFPAQESIYNFIKTRYTAQHFDYLLLVGDNTDIPPREDSGMVVNSILTFAGPSDASYGYLSGNDHYPDVHVGRFSMSNAAELMTQLKRTIRYEKYPSATQNWYNRAVGVASNEGPGDDNEKDWEHMRNIRTQLMGSGYAQIGELYDSTHGLMDAPGDPQAQDAAAAINGGISLFNYCGHGWDQGIATTGFSTTEVPGLTNNSGAVPYVFVVGCQVGAFVDNTCFAEALMRQADAQMNPTGSIANFMSTINQSWSPPMEAQDMSNAIISGSGSNHLDNLGVIANAGCASMNAAYTTAGYEMTDTWVFFGDPSVQFRKKVPAILPVIHPATITSSQTSFTTLVNNSDAVVTLIHADTVFMIRDVVNNTAFHEFTSLPPGDSLMVWVTAPNAIPYTGKIKVVQAMDVASATQANGIGLYPNPAKEKLFLTGINSDLNYTIIDVSGKLISCGTTSESRPIDVHILISGNYLLRLEDNTVLPFTVQ